MQTEAPLLIRPYLADMTRSEIHAVMTGGYATIAGSLLGAYISFGVCSPLPLFAENPKNLKPSSVGTPHGSWPERPGVSSHGLCPEPGGP